MAEYDGSIRIGTKIDTQGFDEDGKKLEAKAKKLADNISGSSDVEIKIDASGAKKEIEEVFEDIEKEEKRIEELAKKAVEKAQSQQSKIAASEEPRYETISSQGYNQEAIKFIEDYEKETLKADEHLNQLRVDIEEYAKSLKELKSQGQFFGDEDYDRVYLAWKNATDAVKAYQAELNKKTESGQAKIAEQEAKAAEKREAAQRRIEEQAERNLQKENARIQREAENQAKLEAKEAERKAKEEARIAAIQAKEEARRAKEIAAIQAQQAEEQRLDQIRINAVASNDRIIEKVERIKQLEQEISELKKAGITEGYQDYDDRIQELEKLKGEIQEYKNNLRDVPDKFSKMRDSAKKAFDAASEGAKKSTGLLSTFISRMKGLALSLLIFNWISKGFNAMISGMKAGFSNFAGYSDSYAQSVQNMKNSMSTLGNQFAAAFAPIVQMVIPWLNSLINALTTAMTYVAQFFAVLGGKSTFTKAKKLQDSYNKSLGGTAKAADKARGALAKFDDLDVLQKQDDAGGGGGGGAGDMATDMFEEVPVDYEVAQWIDDIINKLNILKGIFAQGFWDGLGDWGAKWEDIKNNASSIKDTLIGIWTDPEVVSSSQAWSESIIYMLGALAGSVTSIGLTIAANILGGIEIYLGENKDRIKEFLISMFDISTEVNYMFAELFSSIAFVFEAFASEQGQQLTANIIGIFADSFMGIIELASKFALDILNIFIQPFVENKEQFRTALEGFLGVLSEVAGTIKRGIDETFSKLNEVYDEHFKPFFDSVADGLSKLVEHFLTFWNEQVQPILEEWAENFDLLWQEHIQPMINNFIELLGQAADFLKEVWENIIMPFVQWIIDNILPIILPIIDGVVNALMAAAGGIADAISGVIDVFKGLLTFLSGVFTGDWDKAWEGITQIVEGVKNTIKGIINAILGAVESMANGVVKAVNKIIDAINGLEISNPFTGEEIWSPNIKPIPPVSIPRLATGSVIRGGNPFMAILGDQPAGQVNVEAPLDTIRQALREELSSANLGGAGGGALQVVLNVNGEDLARATINDWLSELSRQGYDVSVLGVT